MAEYNGHHCKGCWNVALWLGGDEGLYNVAMSYARRIGPKYNGTRAAIDFIQDTGLRRTPDGFKYTIKAVRSALLGFIE